MAAVVAAPTISTNGGGSQMANALLADEFHNDDANAIDDSPSPEVPGLGPAAAAATAVWNPAAPAFLLAALATSPFVAWVALHMKLMALPYLSIHLLSVPLALHLRDRQGWVRWLAGFLAVGALGQIKTAVMLSSFAADTTVVTRGLFYAFTALWECSNAVPIFGGRAVLDRYGIESYRRAALAATCPSLIKFDAQPQPQSQPKHLLVRSAQIGGYIGAFFGLRRLLGYAVGFVEKHVVLEAEALAVLFSCLVNVWNVPPLLFQWAMMAHHPTVRVIYPYGSVYLTTSSRDFWSKWSRPATSLIRRMVYYPLGGGRRAWLSIPLMFLLNASGHFGVSEALVGDAAELGWLTVFGVLGLVATVEVVGNQFLELEHIDPGTGVGTGRSVAPSWWWATRLVLAFVALRFAAFTLLRKCLNASLSDLVGSDEA